MFVNQDNILVSISTSGAFAAFGLVAFGLVALGLVALGLVAFGELAIAFGLSALGEFLASLCAILLEPQSF